MSLWPDINAVVAAVLRRCRRLRRRALQQRRHHLRRVRLREAARLSGRVGAQHGRATSPSRPPADVAIALTKATLNADLTQNLVGVYTNPDPRAYPVSSYSYLIVPTTTASPFTAAKGVTLSKFILYMVCAGQQEAAAARLLAAAAEPRARRVQRRAEDPRAREPTADQPVRQPHDHSQIHEWGAPPPPPSAKQGATPPNQTTVTNPTSNVGTPSGLQQTPSNTNNPLAGTTGARARVSADKSRTGAAAANGAAQTQAFAAASGPVRAPDPRDPLPMWLYILAAVVALLGVFGPPALSSLRHPHGLASAARRPHRTVG